MKLLKLVKPYSVILDSGRSDISSIVLSPKNSTVEYALVVDEDVHSATYNHNVIQDYLDKNILTVVQAPDPIVWNNLAVSFAPASSGSFISGGGGSATWPIIGASGNFTFTQGAYITGTGDQFIVTQTGPAIVGGTLPLNVQTNQSNGATSDYTCTVLVNGQTLTAVLTIEYVPLGS